MSLLTELNAFFTDHMRCGELDAVPASLSVKSRRVMRAHALVGITSIVLFTAWTATAQSPSVMPSIDLLAGTIDGRLLSEWNVDRVTDAFGRPSAVNRGIDRTIGPQVHYHEAGLSFWFHEPSKDPQRSLWLMTIYLSRSWDSEYKLHYQQFRGQLSPPVDANWKADRLMRELAEHNPTVETAAERERQLKSMRLPGMGVGPMQDVIRIKRDGHSINFLLDPTTKFVERVSLQSK